jgi:hypothetical protein
MLMATSRHRKAENVRRLFHPSPEAFAELTGLRWAGLYVTFGCRGGSSSGVRRLKQLTRCSGPVRGAGPVLWR